MSFISRGFQRVAGQCSRGVFALSPGGRPDLADPADLSGLPTGDQALPYQGLSSSPSRWLKRPSARLRAALHGGLARAA